MSAADPARPPAHPAPARRPAVLGLIALLIALTVFMVWAATAPLDEGVPTAGVVTVDTKRKTVQHLTGGVIEQVLVREAQQVKAGEPLIRLNDFNARAALEAARQRYLSLRATQARLQAELAGADRPAIHPDVLAGMDQDPVLRSHVETEQQVFSSRRQALRSELAAMDEMIRSQEELAAGYAAQLVARRQQLALFREERDGLRDMVGDGYAPRNKLLELERNMAELGAIVADLDSSRVKALRSRAELSLRRAQRVQENLREVSTQQAEIQRSVVADEEKYKAARDEFGRMVIRAPTDGSVVGIASQTVGGVIQAGVRIMDIVPQNEALVLEAHIPPHLIDRVHGGLPTDIRFSGFPQTPGLVIEGTLASVSADVLTDPANNSTYYLGRVTVGARGIARLGQHKLTPGMPVEIIIKTGERTFLAYLVAPLLRRLSRSAKEA
jgi:protease secretion system membrane fusion protein